MKDTLLLFHFCSSTLPPVVISSAARNLPCTPSFLAPLAENFPFSAISHRTLYQCARKIEGFVRDDDTGIALSKHIRCTLRGINPFPHTVISSVARNLSCTPSFLAPFAERFSPFPLSHIQHYPLLQDRSLDFARDDFTEAALSKHIRCSLHEINPFPHTVISSAARNLPCALLFLTPFAKGFPFSAVSHRTIYTIPSFRA